MKTSYLVSTAIKPSIALSLTNMAKPNSFKLTEETNYAINTGAEFGIRCSSEVFDTDSETSGVITWYMEPG